MIAAYVESSALVKLALDEPHARALRRSLTDVARITSDLSITEVTRAMRRSDGDAGLARARASLLTFETIPLDRATFERAATLDPPTLRSLDALHVASALALGVEHVVFYSYDQRTLDAARANGLVTASPGT